MDKLVFKQWKIKNNNKKNPNTASFHLYKIFKYLKTYIYRYKYNFIYLHTVDKIRKGHPADLNDFLTYMMATYMFIYLYLTCYNLLYLLNNLNIFLKLA